MQLASITKVQTLDIESLKQQYVGTSLKDAPVPSAVLDLAKVKRNCERMLDAVDKIGCGWRAHIKTHKTTELTELQVGSDPKRPANLVVSTLNEAESILPLLLTYKAEGRKVDLLYGFPVYPSAAPRLAAIAKELGPLNLSLMIDHPDQVNTVREIFAQSQVPVSIYIKIEMGAQRSGVVPNSELMYNVFEEIDAARDSCSLVGLYSHAGHSYYGSTPDEAMRFFLSEIDALNRAARCLRTRGFGGDLILTLGATPTATSARNVVVSDPTTNKRGSAVDQIVSTLEVMEQGGNCSVELHAGVYPVLDVQQLATHALPAEHLSWDDLALTILTEVASLYPDREKPEALIAAGSIALGREPCKAYPGWGIISPWNIDGAETPTCLAEEHKEWQVGKISQEHGILRWAGVKGEEQKLTVGQRLRVWPNHACIAGVGFDYYLVVDSSREGSEDEIVNIWPRWRGW